VHGDFMANGGYLMLNDHKLLMQPFAWIAIFGEVALERQSYGGRGLENLCPLDAELNLPQKHYSHTLQRRIAIAVAKGSYDDAVATIAEMNEVKIGKCQAEETTIEAARDFDI
jgi:hypothetical protein